ncbi:hypothetical protein MKX01_031360 [Papaver californicum]|nr:hypothetical protein MKX01_031360 [Papaver californicum]
MTIWGVELEPGETFTYRFNKANGKLHISQLTSGKIIDDDCLADVVEMKCDVGDGDQMPIVLCRFSYMRQHMSSYALNYEFGEDDGHVTFYVTGNYSVHLAGYFLGKGDSCRDQG